MFLELFLSKPWSVADEIKREEDSKTTPTLESEADELPEGAEFGVGLPGSFARVHFDLAIA